MWEHERKLQQATKHFEQLDAQLDGWEKGNGYTLRVQPDPEPPRYIIRAQVIRPVEDEPFPLVVGDFLQNARSALDYLAGALGDVGAGGCMSDRDALVTMFPIARSPERFAQLAKGRLPTISEPVRTVIEDLQPYETGGDLWNIEPLWLLNELARLDRHRFLHVGYERVGNLGLNPRTSRNVRVEDFFAIDGPFDLADIDAIEEGDPTVDEYGAKLATFSAFPIDPDEEIHMDWESAIEITFDRDRLPETLTLAEGVPIISWLRLIVPEVREVFRALAPFLPSEPPRW
jgi:hypothetical protein